MKTIARLTALLLLGVAYRLICWADGEGHTCTLEDKSGITYISLN